MKERRSLIESRVCFDKWEQLSLHLCSGSWVETDNTWNVPWCSWPGFAEILTQSFLSMKSLSLAVWSRNKFLNAQQEALRVLFFGRRKCEQPKLGVWTVNTRACGPRFRFVELINGEPSISFVDIWHHANCIVTSQGILENPSHCAKGEYVTRNCTSALVIKSQCFYPILWILSEISAETVCLDGPPRGLFLDLLISFVETPIEYVAPISDPLLAPGE